VYDRYPTDTVTRHGGEGLGGDALVRGGVDPTASEEEGSSVRLSVVSPPAS
jgi:hypothetical protein